MAKKSGKPAAPKAKRSATAQSEFSQPKKRRAFTVFLIVDDRTVRDSLVATLREQQIDVQDYMTAMEFYRDYRKPSPGVLISEIKLRGMTGLELFEKLTAEKNDLLVAFIAGNTEAPLAVQAMKAGAIDFLVRTVQEESLIALVARAYAMFYDVDWNFVGEDLDDVEKGISRVTGREKQILDLVADGLSSREIGTQLNISTKTVEALRASLNDKMRADDLPHLIRMVMAYNEEQGA